MSANPQQRDLLEKFLEKFSERDSLQHIYLEETNLYFYLVLHGVLVLMVRKSDLLIVHQEYMGQFNSLNSDLLPIEKAINNTWDATKILKPPFSSSLTFFSYSPPYKLNSMKSWNRNYSKVMKFDAVSAAWKNHLLTAELSEKLCPDLDPKKSIFESKLTHALLSDVYVRPIFLMWISKFHLINQWHFSMFRRKLIIATADYVQHRELFAPDPNQQPDAIQ